MAVASKPFAIPPARSDNAVSQRATEGESLLAHECNSRDDGVTRKPHVVNARTLSSPPIANVPDAQGAADVSSEGLARCGGPVGPIAAQPANDAE
jgi:hypothetical protein